MVIYLLGKILGVQVLDVVDEGQLGLVKLDSHLQHGCIPSPFVIICYVFDHESWDRKTANWKHFFVFPRYDLLKLVEH